MDRPFLAVVKTSWDAIDKNAVTDNHSEKVRGFAGDQVPNNWMASGTV
jgi:hypothetical protein